MDSSAAGGQGTDGAPHRADKEEETENKRFPEHPHGCVGRFGSRRAAGRKTDDRHAYEERRHGDSSDPQPSSPDQPANEPKAADFEPDGAFAVKSREDVFGANLIAVGDPHGEFDHRAQFGDVSVAVLERNQRLLSGRGQMEPPSLVDLGEEGA